MISCKDIILTVRLEQIGIDRVSGVENCLRMAYVCQQEQNSSTLEDMGAEAQEEGVPAAFPQGSVLLVSGVLFHKLRPSGE